MCAGSPAFTLLGVSQELEDLLRFGTQQEQAGLIAVAEAAYRRVLDATRGSGTPVEREVTVSLARLCGNDGREFEALALASRARDLATAAGDAWRLALAQLQLANALDAVEDYARIGPLLERIARGLDVLEPTEATRLRLSVALHRARLVANLGDVDGVAAALAAVDEASRAATGQPVPARIAWLVQVVALNTAGREAEVVPWLDRIPATDGLVRRELEYAEQRVRCLLTVAPDPDGLAATDAFLTALGTAPKATVGAAWRLRAVVGLGTRLAAVAGPSSLTRLAWDMAGEAIVTRVAQIELCVRQVPEVAAAGSDVLELLASYRQRFRDRHDQLLAEVGLARPWPPVDSGASVLKPGLAVVCAWCARVRAHDGAWMPVRQFLPPEHEHFKMSHGICAGCWSRTVGDLAAYAPTRTPDGPR